MKTYKTPRTKTIKMDAEELMQQMAPASLTDSDEEVNAADARSKRHTGLFDDDESYAD